MGWRGARTFWQALIPVCQPNEQTRDVIPAPTGYEGDQNIGWIGALRRMQQSHYLRRDSNHAACRTRKHRSLNAAAGAKNKSDEDARRKVEGSLNQKARERPRFAGVVVVVKRD